MITLANRRSLCALLAFAYPIAAYGCGGKFVADDQAALGGSAGQGSTGGAGAGGGGVPGSGGRAGTSGEGGTAGTGGSPETGGVGGSTGGVSGTGGTTGGTGGTGGVGGTGGTGGTGGVPRNSIDRVSKDKDGVQGNGPSSAVVISESGRFIAFISKASNLTHHPPNGYGQVFVRDRQMGTVELISVNASGKLANSDCTDPGISADGTVVSFATQATNLAANDENSKVDVYVRDRDVPTTELVSVGDAEQLSNDNAWVPSLSADGQVVAWVSGATNLTANDSDTSYDVFVRDRGAGTTVLASVDSAENKEAKGSWAPSLSADGSLVVFESFAELTSSDNNGYQDIFLRDLDAGQTFLVSVSSGEVQANDFSSGAQISADGTAVAFSSYAAQLVSGDNNGAQDLFVRDLVAGTTERVSISSTGVETDANSSIFDSSISGNGLYVAFTSNGETLVGGDNNGLYDIFVRDRLTDETFRVNLDRNGAQTRFDSSDHASISGDGRWVAFVSYDQNLVPGDDNNVSDVFVAAVP